MLKWLAKILKIDYEEEKIEGNGAYKAKSVGIFRNKEFAIYSGKALIANICKRSSNKSKYFVVITIMGGLEVYASKSDSTLQDIFNDICKLNDSLVSHRKRSILTSMEEKSLIKF